MVVGDKTVGARQTSQVLGHGLLERRRGGHVGDLAAPGAKQVVVVLGDVLGQFEAGELVVGRDAPHDPDLLQVDEVAVRGAAREPWCQLGDVTDAHRVARPGKYLDDLAPAAGVPLGDLPEPLLYQAVQCLVHQDRPYLAAPACRIWGTRLSSGTRLSWRSRRPATTRPREYQTTARPPTKKPIGQLDS